MLLTPPSGHLQISRHVRTQQAVTAGSYAAEPPHWGNVKVSIVIPTFNEGQNLREIVQLLSQSLDEILAEPYELIVVDDNSPDRTWKLAEALMKDYPQLQVIRRTQERGLSSAVVRGWQAAQGEFLGVIDADLQHPPEIVSKLLGAMKEGADLAVASRHVTGGGVSEWSLRRRFLSRGAQILGLILLPSVVGRVSDPMSGYFMVRRTAIAGPLLNPQGYKILIEVLAKGNIRTIAEVGYVFQERQGGKSKVTGQQYIDYLIHLLRLRSQPRPKPTGQHNPLPVGKFLRFCLVGLSGVFVDMAVLYLLSDPSTLGWGLTRSKAIAAEVAILNNFIWNDQWTFNDISRQQKGWRRRIKRFMKFNFICLFGLSLNLFILNILFNYFGINRYLANFIAIAVVTSWNFLINWKLSWRVTDEKTLPK
jgi:dolichol-phosphate mannosyltransferase